MFANFRVYVILLGVSLTSCGTYTPIPTQGGGKRFSVEQALISSSMRKSINDLPLDMLVDKKINLELTIIPDSGGGSTNGGRLFANQILSDINQQTFGSTTRTLGFSGQPSDISYSKDLIVNQSDAKQFQSLLISSLLKHNILLNPTPDEGDADFMLEIFVDVLGIWKSKTDWLIINSEQLKASTSIEFIITPLTEGSSELRHVGRIAYDAEYKENYTLWMGPYESDIVVRPNVFLEKIQPVPLKGTSNYSNLKRAQPKNLIPEQQETPLIINPTIKK